jgi:4-hydroxybenzoate polyprenyltransferase
MHNPPNKVNTWVPYLQLLRPKNILILVATQWVLKYFLYDRILRTHSIEPVFSLLEFGFLTGIAATVLGAGNVINDYFDQETDRLHPLKPSLVGNQVSESSALLYYGFLIALGLGPALWLSTQHFTLLHLALLPLAHLLLYLYSRYLKPLPLAGNILVAGLGAAACLLVGLAEMQAQAELKKIQPLLAAKQTTWLIGFSAMAFLLHWGREIIKDIEDLPADQASNLKTLAVLWGLEKSKTLALALLLCTLLPLLLWGIGRGFQPLSPEILYHWLVLMPALLLALFFLLRASHPRHFRRLSSIYKIIMVLGLIYLVLASW